MVSAGLVGDGTRRVRAPRVEEVRTRVCGVRAGGSDKTEAAILELISVRIRFRQRFERDVLTFFSLATDEFEHCVAGNGPHVL